MICVVPENIHTSPTEGIFSKNPSSHPSRNSNKALHISLNFLVLQNLPPPRKFQSLLWGEYGYFLDLHIVTRSDISKFWYTQNQYYLNHYKIEGF